MNTFHEQVLHIVHGIPRGMVVSYGQVAAYVGMPSAAQEVGSAMGALGKSPDFPWWRVLNKDGHISLDNPDATPQEQQKLLEEEGVVFMEPLQLDIKRYRFRPTKEVLETYPLQSTEVEEVYQKYAINQLPLL